MRPTEMAKYEEGKTDWEEVWELEPWDTLELRGWHNEEKTKEEWESGEGGVLATKESVYRKRAVASCQMPPAGPVRWGSIRWKLSDLVQVVSDAFFYTQVASI